MAVEAEAEGWEEIATGVLGSLSLTWGGLHDIVVPISKTGPHSAFAPIVRAFDPDWVSTYRVTNFDVPGQESDDMWIADVADEDITTVASWCSPYATDHEMHPWAFRGRAVCRPLIPLAAFTEAWWPELLDLDLSKIDPLLALMVRLRTGILADAEDLPVSCSLRELHATESDAPALTELAVVGSAGFHRPSADSDIRHMSGLHADPSIPLITGNDPTQPLMRTRYGMAHLQGAGHQSPPWTVVLGDTFEDFCLALACDRLLGGATWLPMPQLPKAVLASAIPALHRKIGAVWTATSTAVPMTSISMDQSVLTEMREQLGEQGLRACTDERTIVVAPDELSFDNPVRLGDRDHLALAETSAVHCDGDGSLHVDTALHTPIPEVARKASEEVTWEVDVRVEGEQPPARPVLGSSELLVTKSSTENIQVRVGAEDLTYHSHSAMFRLDGWTLEVPLARPRLRIPAADEIVRRLAGSAGYSAQPSQTGRLNNTMIELWGGIDALTVDLEGPVWPLLKALTPVEREKNGCVDGRLVVNGQPYVTFGQAASLMDADDDETRVNLDGLLQKRVLQRGLVLRCGRCNWLGWYSLGTFGQDFNCLRCGNRNVIRQELWRDPFDEPSWYYDLDNAVREALRLNGRVPILAIKRLSDRYNRAFSYATDFELFARGETRPTVEIDFAVFGDGKVVIGESKASNKLGNTSAQVTREMGKLLTAYQALTADSLCLATSLAAWSGLSRSVAQAACRDARASVEFLEGLGL